MSSLLLTPKGVSASDDVGCIPKGYGYFVPSLVPHSMERQLRVVLAGRWAYKHVIMDGLMGVLAKPIGPGRGAGKSSQEQSAALPTDE
jgi:hypothetical protein